MAKFPNRSPVNGTARRCCPFPARTVFLQEPLYKKGRKNTLSKDCAKIDREQRYKTGKTALYRSVAKTGRNRITETENHTTFGPGQGRKNRLRPVPTEPVHLWPQERNGMHQNDEELIQARHRLEQAQARSRKQERSQRPHRLNRKDHTGERFPASAAPWTPSRRSCNTG